MARTTLTFAAIALALGSSLVQAEDKSDLKLIQGTWKVVVGDAADNEPIVGDLLTFSPDGRLTIQKERGGASQKETGTFAIDPSKSPKTIDLKPDKNSEGQLIPGIYELTGDRLKICVAGRGKPRPTQFDSPGNDSIFLLAELERQK